MFNKMISRRPGYTLIEMLISVAVFAGLIIIVLGSVATSSSSSARVNILRDKTEAARSLVDQITNDFRYIYTKKEAKDNSNQSRNFKGYFISQSRDELVLLLHYPGTAETELVKKQYLIGKRNNNRQQLTLFVNETRNCEIQPGQNNLSCRGNQSSGSQDLLSTKYVLDDSGNYESQFSGLTILQADSRNPIENGYLEIKLSIKPVEYTQSCATIPEGNCFKIATSLNAGLI